MPDIKLLDCTLRDGGYVNSWNWGFAAAKDIIASLTRAGTDIVEVGFLRNVDGYNPDVTVCNTIEELNRLLPAHTGSTMYSGMAMRSNYDIAKLSPYEGHGIEMLRITAHDYDIHEGMDFAREVKARGYKLSINPINIMGYADKDLLWILDQVNEIHPYQFSIVDTFGSMRRRDLERIVSLVDHNLAPDIRVGLHLHENMALSFCLAQEFLDKHLGRDTTVDGSLMGMGRIPGNLPIELIADYMNETLGCHYDIDEMMDAIQDHIAPLKGETAWGYTPAYFLSARYNLHRDYAEHYLDKGDLTNRDINHILAGFDRSKATAYDKDYADRLYREYQNRAIDDTAALDTLADQAVLQHQRNLFGYADTLQEVKADDSPHMILADDNFATIVSAAAEGRRIYDNIRKAIQFLLASNLSEVLTIFCATMIGIIIGEDFTVFLPVHLLWINLITDCFPALSLGLEKPEADVMQKAPRDPKEGVFAGGMGIAVAYQGVYMTVITLVSYCIGRYVLADMHHAAAIAAGEYSAQMLGYYAQEGDGLLSQDGVHPSINNRFDEEGHWKP